MQYWLQGALLGLAYLAPIGMQNLYVMNTALRMGPLRTYQVAGITTAFDISLALSCFFGVGLLLEKVPALINVMLLVGCLALSYFGVRMITAKPSSDREVNVNEPLLKVTIACFAVTWLNPQAVLDGTMLLGSMRASLPAGMATAFIFGIVTASCLWFCGLATATRIFKSALDEKVMKWINVLCGTVVILYGLKLGYELLQAVL
ncbi:putative lysine exporter (LysE family) [Methanocella arvoryzae MRE50]|uniref:Lysine exporter (LysE family) n=1 Tax=Methanocella arvoryzae (strain DSM 22066 / NBRC 105507 / MRE50) TaxID=351160 RepID=Q0W889_METAR|nr:putative lysine exporter (LysE family) [Methanocella arvoryzae MRE50]